MTRYLISDIFTVITKYIISVLRDLIHLLLFVIANFSLYYFQSSKNILHKYFVFQTVNSKIRNKDSQINQVYLIYAFCVVSANEKNEKNELAVSNLC